MLAVPRVLGRLQSLEFASPPRLFAAQLAPTLQALVVVAHTTGTSHALLPDGTRNEYQPGHLLLAFRTGQLARARLEIGALARSFVQCEALQARARGTVNAVGKMWSEALTPLHEKMGEVAQRLIPRGTTVAHEFLSLLVAGTSPSYMHQFFIRDLKEADLARMPTTRCCITRQALL